MNFDEFFKELEETRRDYDWKIDPDGMITGKSKRPVTYMVACPITAVYRRKFHKTISLSDHFRAAKQLKLRNIDKIVCAADNVPSYSYDTRNRIKKALRIKGEPDYGVIQWHFINTTASNLEP
jgi:hypothetical protein